MRPLVVPLDEIDPHDLAHVGEKAANLGALLKAGMPVPPGFCVVTDAYVAFAHDADIAALTQAAARLRADDARVGEIAASIRTRLLATPVRDDVARAIGRALAQLDSPAVAVRSSVALDGVAGNAGSHETFLGVSGLGISGADAVVDAVRRCWASLWTEQAAMMRARHGLDPRFARIAVVVERMVDADAAGVLFTVDPVDRKSADQLIIDAAPGLGDAVVSGRVTPDHIVVDKRTLDVVLARSGRPARAGDDGLCVAPESVRVLARLAMEIERLFKAPQDIEWAVQDGRVSLLQSRAIDGVDGARAPRRRSGLEPLARALSSDLLPVRPYPLDVTSYTRTMLEAMERETLSPLGLRLASTDDLFRYDAGVVVSVQPRPVRPTVRVLWRPLLALWKARRTDPALLADDPVVGEVKARAKALAEKDLPHASVEELFAFLDDASKLGPRVASLRRRYFPRPLKDTAVLWCLLALVGERARLPDLVAGHDMAPLALNRALEELVSSVRSDADLVRTFASTDPKDLPATLDKSEGGRAFLGQLQAFLDAHGDVDTGGAFLASLPAWKNAPNVPLAIVKSLAAAAPASTSTIPAERAASALAYVEHETVLGRRPLSRWFRHALAGARHVPRLREDTRALAGIGLPVVHAVFQELGRRLVDKGALEDPGSIVHLTLDEVRAAFAPWADATFTRALVESRSRKRALMTSSHPWRAELAEPPSQASKDGALVVGAAASPGDVVGTVHVVQGPDDFGSFCAGEILVCTVATPSFSPLLAGAAALVTDAGASSSHAGILARELGVPAVLGTGDATVKLIDGQRVRVDGSRGLVTAA